MRTESTTPPRPPVNSSLSSSDVLERYWKSWKDDQPLTMGEIMKPLSLSEMATLKPGDPRWGAPISTLDAYQCRPARTHNGQRLIGF